MRQTSIDVYRQIEQEGLLSKLRFSVYSALFKNGPCTALELYTKCFKNTCGSQSITPRFAELEKVGAVYSVRHRPCLVSGREVIEWDVTDKLPVKPEKLKRHTCSACEGRGYIEETQRNLF